MTKERTLRSRAYLMPASDIDTDQIFPSRFQNRVDGKSDLSDFFFHDQRFDAQGKPISEAVLNNPQLRGARILISPRNYACGSARAGAILAHRDFGIRILLSESFGQVFPTVCYKFGVIPIELPKPNIAAIMRLLAETPLAELEVDLEVEEIRLPDNGRLGFRLDGHVRTIALSGHDELGLTLTHSVEIAKLEAERRKVFPWLFEEPTTHKAGV